MIEHRRLATLVVALTMLLVCVDLLLMDQRAWTVAAAALAVVLLGLFSGLVVLGYAVAIWVPSLASAFDDDRTPGDLASVLAKILVVIPIRTVLLEELAFRGVLWGWLAKTWGERIATWGSSLAFGLWHVPPALVVLKTNDALAISSPWARDGGELRGAGTGVARVGRRVPIDH